MKKPRSAGELQHRIAFDKRVDQNPDSPADYGNTVSDWEEQFVTRAGLIHLRGGEQVIAARLNNTHPLVMYVRSSADTRSITSAWRARDTRTGKTYNLRDITPAEDRRWIDILAITGVADG